MPSIPMKIQSNSDIRAFNTAADTYKACIDGFISGHRSNIDSSMDAMKDASADWSRFVKLLNASPTYQKHVSPIKKDTIPIQAETSPAPYGSHNVGHSDPTQIKANFSF